MLGIFAYNDLTDQYVEYNTVDSDNPIPVLADPLDETTVYVQLFLRNDDVTKYYTTTTAAMGPSTSTVDNPMGMTFKLVEQNAQPAAEDWEYLSSGNTISFGSIGSSLAADLDYFPFWLQVVIPRATPVNVYNAIQLELSYVAEGIVVI